MSIGRLAAHPTYTAGVTEGAHDIPLDEVDGHLAEVVGRAARGDRIVYLTDRGRRVAAIVPVEDAWYWTPGWQHAEAEADADIRDGRTRSYENIDEMFAELDAVRDD